MSGKSLTVVSSHGAIAETTATNLTPAVREGMQDLLVAFASPAEDGVDRVRLVKIWAREIAEFEPEIVVEALRSLLRNNPRNPFRPSVQDVIGRCERVRADWVKRTHQWYCGETHGEPLPGWCTKSSLLRVALGTLLSEWDLWYRPRGPYGENQSRHPSVTDADYRGWRIATEIGPRISEWPADLLAEYRVLTGADYERVNRVIAVEEAKEARVREWRTANCEAQRQMSNFQWNEQPLAEQRRRVFEVVLSDPASYPELAKDARTHTAQLEEAQI